MSPASRTSQKRSIPGTAPDPKQAAEAVGQFIETLKVMGAKAADKGIEEVALKAIISLRRLGLEAAEKGLEKASQQTVLSIDEVGYKAAERVLRYAAEKAALSLGELGSKAAQKGLGDLALKAASALNRVWIKAAERDLQNVVWETASSLVDIGVIAAKPRFGATGNVDSSLNLLELTSRKAAISLWTLGAWATYKKIHKLSEHIISGLGSIRDVSDVALVQNAYDVAKEAVNYFGLPELPLALENFKASYQQQKDQIP